LSPLGGSDGGGSCARLTIMARNAAVRRVAVHALSNPESRCAMVGLLSGSCSALRLSAGSCRQSHVDSCVPSANRGDRARFAQLKHGVGSANGPYSAWRSTGQDTAQPPERACEGQEESRCYYSEHEALERATCAGESTLRGGPYAHTLTKGAANARGWDFACDPRLSRSCVRRAPGPNLSHEQGSRVSADGAATLCTQLPRARLTLIYATRAKSGMGLRLCRTPPTRRAALACFSA
jgi:hypothetical protein